MIDVAELHAALNRIPLPKGQFFYVFDPKSNRVPARTRDEHGQPLPYVELGTFRVSVLTEAEEEW